MKPETEAYIREHAVATFPKECCGLVAIIKGKERYIPCRNIADSRESHFIMPAEDWIAVEDRGEVIAVVHSHVNEPARPSSADLASCEKTKVPWHIVHVSIPDGGDAPVADEIYTFEPTGFTMPLIGRPFVHGVHDCYALVRDFYELEMGVTLPDFEREDKWWDKGQTLYQDNFEACGFAPIKGPIQVGDAILMQIRSPTPNHAAVYIGNGQILHHFYGRMSGRELYGGYWQENTVMILRRKKDER
jgi:proteasome lid subunit RPN8/RPN11